MQGKAAQRKFLFMAKFLVAFLVSICLSGPIFGMTPFIKSKEVIEESNNKNLIEKEDEARGTSYLFDAVARGETSGLQPLTSFVLLVRNEKGMTLLHYAAQNGHRAVVGLLIDGRAQIDIGDHVTKPGEVFC